MKKSAKGRHGADPVERFMLDLIRMAHHAAFAAHAVLAGAKREAPTGRGVTLFCGVVKRPKLRASRDLSCGSGHLGGVRVPLALATHLSFRGCHGTNPVLFHG